jgi:hypothetical protein
LLFYQLQKERRPPFTTPPLKDRTMKNLIAHATKKQRNRRDVDRRDQREQLVNDGTIGSIEETSLPVPRITLLRGILLDIDPRLFKVCGLTRAQRSNPVQFYETLIRPMLQRNPVLSKAEVRMSGRGLHVIVRLTSPIEFETESQRAWWSLAVKCIQRLLPSDPDVPGITAMTRPIGSINGKNGRKVVLLKNAEPVSVAEVQKLVSDLCDSPMRTVVGVLFGAERVTPCPICRGDESSLIAFDRFAKCYGCGTIKLEQLYDIFLADRPKRKGD